MLAYFDTNVFSNLLKREQGMTAQHEMDLRSSISAGRIVIPLSYLTLEETIAAPDDIRVAQSLLIQKLSSPNRFIRPVSDILAATIRSFARYGVDRARVWMRGETLRLIHSNLHDVLVGTEPQDVVDRAVAVKSAQAEKQSFREVLRAIRREILPAIRGLLGAAQSPTFEWFFDEKAVAVAESFADRVGLLDECRSRGIDSLLAISAIRMAVGASLSFVYAAGFERRREKRSDSRDVLHATLAAAAADVFVTHDNPLREELLSRVPLQHFRMMRLPDLLEEVAGTLHQGK